MNKESELKELSFLFHEDVQRIFNNFTALFQIRIGFYSPEGRELKVGMDRDLCRYCSMIRQCPGGEAACEEQDRQARLKAAEKGVLLVYTCHGGMTEAVKPILSEERLIGFAMIGQIRRNEQAAPRWQSLWKEEYPGLSLQEAFEEQPVRRKSELDRILEFFSDLMDLLSRQGMIRSRGGDRLTDLLVWIKDNITGELTLTDAADKINLSSSRLSHLLKARFGLSFTRLVRQIRIDQACLLLSHRSDISIKECALLVGYKDPLYFSRHFKSQTGVNPDQYKKQQNNP